MATTVGEIEIIIKAETDQLLRANKQVDRITDSMESGFKKADRSAEKLNTTVTKTAGAVSGGLRSGMQQAGYQIQDFIVQVQGGQSALVAFSQQGSQLAGAFGPGGAVAGALLALGSILFGTLSTALSSTKDEMEQLKSAAETLNKVVVINSQGVAALSNDYARLAATNATLAAQLRDNAIQQYDIAVRDAGKAITNIIDEQSSWWRSLNGGVANVKAFGGAMSLMEISTSDFNDAIKQATSLGPAFNSSTMTLVNTVAMLSSQFDISDDAAFGLGKRLTELAKNPSPQAVSSLVDYMRALKPTTQDGADAISNLEKRILDAAAAMQQAHDDGEALKNTLNELRTEAQQANFDGISKQLEAQRIALTKGKQAAIEYGIEQQNLTREQKDQLIAASRVNAQLEEEKDKRDKAAKASSRHSSSVDAAQQALAKQSNALSRLNTGYADGSLELAKYDAVVALGNKASAEQIAKAEQQAKSIWKIQQATKAAAEEEKKRTQAGQNFTNLQGQASPVAAVDNAFAQQMAQLDEYARLYPQRIAEAEAVRAGIEEQYRQKRMAAMWEEWQQQSEINNMLGAAIDSLQGGATNAITGLINGTQSLQESFANIGTTILNSVVGSLVQMGIEWVKSQLMGQAAAAASLASTMAQATAAASAWAPAAMSASIATMGSAAAVGQTAYAGSLLAAKGMAVAGARYNGGPVDAGSMYRVGEHGKPEIFQASNGSQYMIPGDNGRVISNRDMHGSGSGGSSVVQHITFEINTTGGIDDATKAWIVKSMKQVALFQISDQANRPNGMIQPRTKR
ncbi:phage tail protein [Salmonella enterica]|uniref:Phage tail protein n=2 Tax=Salmonella enterica TaxID=28901 RepID=A0A619N9W7_SALER|nr:phage tail protein [Salmonella enterica]EAB5620667.1 phage tail protein [Salmonella enterica subsp. enterica serovar Mississippi]ECS7308542.1 phage tail protein [Salmonella enterica subsp. enterica]EDO6546609.1 phage tail protein [Salmonella enterica subsp. enterica serovar 4,[5],12:i:-]EDT1540733.1 phage tail protein [Salmonella enterica subsp. enterica serovar Javiana]EEE7871959.1 phage tail protein [Salmonella enterica subsp. enterica serovar Enteritidis]EHF1407243.1 phage tail protein 